MRPAVHTTFLFTRTEKATAEMAELEGNEKVGKENTSWSLGYEAG